MYCILAIITATATVAGCWAAKLLVMRGFVPKQNRNAYKLFRIQLAEKITGPGLRAVRGSGAAPSPFLSASDQTFHRVTVLVCHRKPQRALYFL